MDLKLTTSKSHLAVVHQSQSESAITTQPSRQVQNFHPEHNNNRDHRLLSINPSSEYIFTSLNTLLHNVEKLYLKFPHEDEITNVDGLRLFRINWEYKTFRFGTSRITIAKEIGISNSVGTQIVTATYTSPDPVPWCGNMFNCCDTIKYDVKIGNDLYGKLSHDSTSNYINVIDCHDGHHSTEFRITATTVCSLYCCPCRVSSFKITNVSNGEIIGKICLHKKVNSDVQFIFEPSLPSEQKILLLSAGLYVNRVFFKNFCCRIGDGGCKCIERYVLGTFMIIFIVLIIIGTLFWKSSEK